MLRKFKNILSENKRIYLLSIFFSLFVVESFFIAQVIFVLPEFKPQYVVVPTLLGLTIGLLLGSVMALRKRLGKQAELFHAIADQAFEFSFYRKPGGKFIYLSPAVQDLTGYLPEEFIKDPDLLRECIHPDDRAIWDDHVHEVDDNHVHNPLLLRITHKNGSQRWIRHLCKPVKDTSGNVVGIRSTNADVTNEVEVKNKIERLANYDPLTELPNRRYLAKNIEELINLAEKDQKLFAVLFVDLDRFKYINDSYGHTFGDRFLRLIGKRLKRNCKDMMVSRFGGDEFVITTHLLEKPEEATAFAERVLKLLERSVEIKTKKLYVSASIGISIYPFDGQDSDTLIKHADAAMYHSKDDGIGNIRYASGNLTTNANQVLTLETRLRQSLDNNEFQLYYQPKVSIPDGTIIGYEALARWQTKEDEVMISPAEFIPLAEETGLIVPLAKQLMQRLCDQAQLWTKSGFFPVIAFNLSARQFNDPNCTKNIVDKWLAAGLPSEMLEIEVTESMIMENFESVLEQLKYLRERGVKISLDDFGTGYSSLGYLRDLPIDTLKIDRTFIRNLHTSQEDEGIIKAIITLAENFNMDVIAEGVENSQQMDLLVKLGCTKAQGYLFSKPTPPEQISIDTHTRIQK